MLTILILHTFNPLHAFIQFLRQRPTITTKLGRLWNSAPIGEHFLTYNRKNAARKLKTVFTFQQKKGGWKMESACSVFTFLSVRNFAHVLRNFRLPQPHSIPTLSTVEPNARLALVTIVDRGFINHWRTAVNKSVDIISHFFFLLSYILISFQNCQKRRFFCVSRDFKFFLKAQKWGSNRFF